MRLFLGTWLMKGITRPTMMLRWEELNQYPFEATQRRKGTHQVTPALAMVVGIER